MEEMYSANNQRNRSRQYTQKRRQQLSKISEVFIKEEERDERYQEAKEEESLSESKI
jgi:hypothetical protein